MKAYNCSKEVALKNSYKIMDIYGVQQEIKKLKEQKRKAIILDENDIVEKYMNIAFSDMTDFVEWGNEESLNYVKFKNSDIVDGGIIHEVKQGKDGISVKLEDRQKALDWLSKFFEMNPESKHRKEYDKEKFRLDRSKFEHTKKIDNKKIELEEKKLNTDTKNEDQQKNIDYFVDKLLGKKEELNNSNE